MYNHAPKDYKCPICIGLSKPGTEGTLIQSDDLIFKDDLVSVIINSFFVGNNPGHVIVVPNEHYENIYDLPNEVGHRVFDISKKMAVAMKEAYNCDGITLRQNNEPAGDQHAFHYHLHVFPRYSNDGFNQAQGEKRLASSEERKVYAVKFKKTLNGLS